METTWTSTLCGGLLAGGITVAAGAFFTQSAEFHPGRMLRIAMSVGLVWLALHGLDWFEIEAHFTSAETEARQNAVLGCAEFLGAILCLGGLWFHPIATTLTDACPGASC